MCGAAAVHIAYGDVSKGKTNAVKVAIASACNYPTGYVTYLSESAARQHLKVALPFVLDDPSNEEVVKQVLINAFGGAEMGTERERFRARCVPIVTANTFVIENLAQADPRYIHTVQ